MKIDVDRAKRILSAYSYAMEARVQMDDIDRGIIKELLDTFPFLRERWYYLEQTDEAASI